MPLNDLAAGWSAFGVASSDAVVVEETPRVLPYPFDPRPLNESWAALESAATERMSAQGVEPGQIKWERFVDIRYTMQINEVQVQSPLGHYGPAEVATLAETFEAEYERLYGKGSGYADAGLTLTAMRVRASARISDFTLAPRTSEALSEHPLRKGERNVIWYERGLTPERTPIFDGHALTTGTELTGPAIVEFIDTTLVVRHQQRVTVDTFGSVKISTGE